MPRSEKYAPMRSQSNSSGDLHHPQPDIRPIQILDRAEARRQHLVLVRRQRADVSDHAGPRARFSSSAAAMRTQDCSPSARSPCPPACGRAARGCDTARTARLVRLRRTPTASAVTGHPVSHCTPDRNDLHRKDQMIALRLGEQRLDAGAARRHFGLREPGILGVDDGAQARRQGRDRGHVISHKRAVRRAG